MMQTNFCCCDTLVVLSEIKSMNVKCVILLGYDQIAHFTEVSSCFLYMWICGMVCGSGNV